MKIRLNEYTRLFRDNILLIGILCLGLLLRLFRLPEMASYDFDQEFVTNFVLDVVRVYPLRFIGQGLSVEGLFMGPWYFYALVPFYLAAGLNPLGGAVGSVLLGTGIIFAYFLVGKHIFSREVGLLAALLRAVSISAIAADWSMVPSYTSDLIILLLWLLFYWIWKDRESFPLRSGRQSEYWYLPTLFLLFGLLTSLHPIHFHFGLIFLFLWAIWRIRFTFKNWLVAGIAFVVPILPLMVFEYLRHFSMTRQLWSMFTGEYDGAKAESFSIDRVEYILKAALRQWLELWDLGSEHRGVAMIFLLSVSILAFWQIRKHFRNQFRFHATALPVTILITCGYYVLFPTHVPEYYLRSLQVLGLLYFAVAVSLIRKENLCGKVVAGAILILYFGFNGLGLLDRWNKETTIRLAQKQAVVKHILEQAAGQPFQISYVTEPGWQYGYASLFRVADSLPGDQGPVYTIVAPATYVDVSTLDFRIGNVGIDYPDEQFSETDDLQES